MRETSGDLRVIRTIAFIKYTFSDMVMKMDYKDISITELTKAAGINRKTFYLHYSSIDDLADDVSQDVVHEILEHMSNYLANMDTVGCIEAFFRYLNDCGPVPKKLLCDENYSSFYYKITDGILASDQFKKFFDACINPEIARDFCSAITFIYRGWEQRGKDISLDELIKNTQKIIHNGFMGFQK